jgi:hypothetical protein
VYHPPVGDFAPVVEWEWQGSTTLPDYNQIMMTPVVADLDDDCLPDVVFSTFKGSAYTTDGVLRAVKGDGSGELFTVTDPDLRVYPGHQLALADVDHDGKVEIFACSPGNPSDLIAFNFDGTLRWRTAGGCTSGNAPAIADVNHDGTPEILAGSKLVDASTGAVVRTFDTAGAFVTAAELDDDDTNGMEIVAGAGVYHADGTLYWTAASGSGNPAIGDLDGDGSPEVVTAVGGSHSLYAYHHDGTPMWGPIDVNQGENTGTGGGPPTIADFDGDGHVDVAVAGGYGYLVVHGVDGSLLWFNTETIDTSSRSTGSSVFDFEGDGKAEAIYNDEHNLRVYRGSDGTVLLKACSTSGPHQENPVIVDVDGDDHAEIVVMNNNYAISACDADLGGGPSHTGFKVIGDAQNRWVRTRKIWNQHAYHVTNINDDGTVPVTEARNWAQPGPNNFRQNVQPNDLLAAPDLTVKLRASYPLCPAMDLLATVINQGAASVPPGIEVTFVRVDEQGAVVETIGTKATTYALAAGATEVLTLPWSPTTPYVEPYGYKVKAVLGGGPAINQCDTTNDESPVEDVGCKLIVQRPAR